MRTSPRYGPLARRPAFTRPPDRRLPWALRLAAGPAPVDAPTDPLARDDATARLEAALMLADEPLPARRLAAVAGLPDAAAARQVVARLRDLYAADGTAFEVAEVAGGFQLLTRPAFHPWLVRLRRSTADLRLSPAAMETLAVVAYRQPVTRADVESVRGVQCGEVLRQLIEKGLVRIAGRDDSLGRPQLYATTRKFLQAFGLNTLRDLPEVEQLRPPAGPG
jgi:segregation and condensation protein B